jgi:hypothetical protein
MATVDKGTLQIDFNKIVEYSLIEDGSSTRLVFQSNGSELSVLCDSEGRVIEQTEGSGDFARALEEKLKGTYVGPIDIAKSKWKLYSYRISGFFE